MEHTTKRISTGMILIFAALAALPALADGPPIYVEGPPPGPPPGARHYYRPLTVMIKVGASDYSSVIGQYTSIGPTWGVALSMHPLPYLGFEVGYDGSRHELDTLRFRQLEAGSFWRNGGSAIVKVTVPFEQLRPFAGVGFGLNYISYVGPDQGGQFQSDFIGEIPLVIGVELHSELFVGGFRATYHVFMDEGFVKSGAGFAHGGMLDVQATMGFRF